MEKKPIREINESVRVIAEDENSITMEIDEDCWEDCEEKKCKCGGEMRDKIMGNECSSCGHLEEMEE